MSKKNKDSEIKLLDSLKAFDLIDEAVVAVDKDFSLIWKNKAASTLSESADKNTPPKKCFNIINKRSSPCEGCPVMLTLQTGKTATAEISSKKPPRHFLVTSHRIPASDKILVTHRDITALWEERSHLRLAFAALPYGIILLDTSFKIQYTNMSFYALFPFMKMLPAGKDLRLALSTYTPPFPDKFEEFIFKVHQDPGAEHDLAFTLSRDLTNCFEVKSLPVFGSERRKRIGNILIFMDTTQEIVTAEIKRREAEKNTVKDILHKLSLTFSPHLKNIQEISNTLRRATPPGEKDKSLALQIIKETKELQGVFEHLEKFYSTPSDTVKVRQINLNQIIRHLIKNRPHENGLTIKLDLSRHVKPFYGDLDMIRALTRQLLENAMEKDLSRVKDTPAPARSIIIKTRMRENIIELIFKDNGAGSEEILPPFSPTDPGEARHELGLYLCEKIAKIHGGSMAVQAVPNVGTKVAVRIPSTPDYTKTPAPLPRHKRPKEKKTGITPKRAFQDSQAWVIGERDFHAGLILKFLDNMSIHHLFISDMPSLEMNLSDGNPSLILINASEKETFLGYLNILKQKKKNSLSRTLLIVPDAILPLMRGRLKDYQVLLMKKPFTLDLLMENISRLLSENSDKHKPDF